MYNISGEDFIEEQGGAELCQAQHSLSFDLGLIIQPAVAGAGSLADRKLKIYWHKGLVRWMKWDMILALVGYLLARS